MSSSDEITSESELASSSESDLNTAPSNSVGIAFGLIPASGICSSCEDADAESTSVICFMCKNKYHAVCRNADGDRKGSKIIVNRTFFVQYNSMVNSDIYQSRPGNFPFVCDSCMTNFEQENAANKEDKVSSIEKRVTDLTNGMNEMKSLLNKIVNDKTSCQEASTTNNTASTFSYANAVITPKRSVLVVEKGTVDAEETKSKVEKIITDNSIHVEKSYMNNKGATVFVCPTEKDRESLSRRIADAGGIKTHQPPERNPTISVANLPRQYTEPELTNLILQAHPDIKNLSDNSTAEIFSVLKMKKQIKDTTKFQATIRVSNKIRKIIEQHGDRLYIEAFSCKVFDHFHVKRCNNCQKFNHYSAECKSNSPVCGHCSENHHSDNCPTKETEGFLKCCTNCKNGRSDSEKHSHTAFDRTCPSYISEQDKLRKSISYYASKN